MIFGCFPTCTILGVRMHAAQSSVGKVLSNTGHVPADRRLLFDQIYGAARIGDIERGLNSGDAGAHNQSRGIHRNGLVRAAIED